MAGIFDSTGKFIPVPNCGQKSVEVTPEIIFAAIGGLAFVDRLLKFVPGLAHLGFDRLADVIPTLARLFTGSNAGRDRTLGLSLLLTGWNGKKIRTVVWQHQNDFEPSETDYDNLDPGETVRWILGTSREAQDMANELLTRSVRPPDCFPEIFNQLADTFPEIGRGLTLHNITRPAPGSSPAPALASSLIAASAIDFTRPYTNKHLDNIPDGTTFARPLASRLSSGKPLIDFSEGIHLNKNLDNIPNGTRAAWDSTTQKSAAVDSSGNLILKNKSNAVGSTSTPSTSSTSFAVIPEMTLTITTNGNKVLINFSATADILGSTVTATAIFAIFRDGIQLSQNMEQQFTSANMAVWANMAITFIDAPSAGSHTYDIRWRVGSGSAGTTITSLGTSRTLQVVELG